MLRADDPLELSAVIYEPALRYLVGSGAVMRQQYRAIVELAELDHVTVQVLPQSVRGYLSAHDFTLLDLGPVLPAAVQVDAGGGPSVTDKPKEVNKFGRRFEAMMRSALAPEDTPGFLHRLAQEVLA